MKQGDIFWVDLEPKHRSETGKIRPALIVSIDEMNDHSPRVIVAPITSNVSRVYRSELRIPAAGGLKNESKIMLDQIRSIDKARIKERLGSIDMPTLKAACELATRLISPPKK